MFLMVFSFASNPVAARKQYHPTGDVAAAVRQIIDSPAHEISYADAKLKIDALINPAIDVDAANSELDKLAESVRGMLATIPQEESGKSIERLRALQAFIYRPGHWNGNKPFSYDHEDPFGQNIQNKLLVTYLETRKGNCVSMPILFLVLGEKLGLDLTLSTAPLHVLVKYTDDTNGKTYNLEATCGAGFTREAWYQKKSPMTEAAIANGVYLKKLDRRETLSVIATVVLEHLIDKKRFEEAIAVADVLIEAFPARAYAMVKKGTAYYHLLNDRILKLFPDHRMIPAELRPLANHYYRQNQAAFEKAEVLGWQ